MKRHNFKKLQIWNDSMEIIDQTYLFTCTFPDFEKFGLRTQMNRCAVSIASNISEGSSKRTDTHFAKYLDNSLGSAFEWETQLIVAYRQNYISEEIFKKMEKDINTLQKKISKFIDSLDI
ncbi:MAG: four helix bundle protein [Flavobacteriaceae bacterium]|nr:four helix bundle protein [Flavobacteriaceae bacterium]